MVKLTLGRFCSDIVNDFGELPADYTQPLGALVTVVFFWLNHYWLHINIGLTVSLSRIKLSMNISSPAITKNDNNEDDTAVHDAAQGLSLPHDPPNRRKG
jgi:hypothetical protein